MNLNLDPWSFSVKDLVHRLTHGVLDELPYPFRIALVALDEELVVKD
jgi:hypothetical protein